MRKPLGCLTRGGITAALLTLAVLITAGLLGGGKLFSPGALNAEAGGDVLGGVRAHAETGGRCTACHVAPWNASTMSDRCLVCHEAVGAELADPDSLHAALGVERGVTLCRDCHTEHNGETAALTVVDLDGFEHEVVGFALSGHGETRDGEPFACAGCHPDGLSGFDAARCDACHRDLDAAYMTAHVGAFGTGCLACHDGVDRYGDTFDHSAVFALEGAHATAPCAGCHPDARSRDDLQAAPATCYSCHEADDAHGGELGEDCAACHVPAAWEEVDFDHDDTEFPLTGAHVEAGCAECHEGVVFAGTPSGCFACHESDDAHDGELGQDCATCHVSASWQEVDFDHDDTGFPLTGGHADAGCSECHEGTAFAGTPSECFACHEADDAHDGELGQDCAACHTPAAWEEVDFDHEDTAFPLEGGHLDVACGECHPNSRFAGTPQACEACHDEPRFHTGLFSADCAGCHTASGWAPARFEQAHTFPIAHGESGPSACRTCHPEVLTGYTCYECHEHQPAEIAQEHREEGIRDFDDCVRCHPTGQKDEAEGEGGDD